MPKAWRNPGCWHATQERGLALCPIDQAQVCFGLRIKLLGFISTLPNLAHIGVLTGWMHLFQISSSEPQLAGPSSRYSFERSMIQNGVLHFVSHKFRHHISSFVHHMCYEKCISNFCYHRKELGEAFVSHFSIRQRVVFSITVTATFSCLLCLTACQSIFPFIFPKH